MIAQMDTVHAIWVVPIIGVSEKQMNVFKPELTRLTNVMSVETTKGTKTDGKWAVLVNPTHFIATKRDVMATLDRLQKQLKTMDATTPIEWEK